MKRGYMYPLILLGAVLAIVVLLSVITKTTPTLDSDRDVLVELYNATDGPNWIDNTNWLTDTPIGEWYGVTAGENGSVIELVLGVCPIFVAGWTQGKECGLQWEGLD